MKDGRKFVPNLEMHFFNKFYSKIAKRIHNPFRKFKIYVKHRLGWLDAPQIIAYEGFGNQNEVHLTGMVIENKGLEKPEPDHTIWENLLATIKRFSGDEIPGVRVKVSFNGENKITETDEFGIFSVKFRNLNLDTEKTYQYSTEILDRLKPDQPLIKAGSKIFIPSGKAKYCVVSDIDDTILVSHASSSLKKLWIILFRNALTRKSFGGVSDFYQRLHQKNGSRNPFFYLSNSEWNLYDLLMDFREYHEFPRGPLLLRPVKRGGLKLLFSGKARQKHKLDKIAMLYKLYPGLKFIFIGDSGQHDAKIYSEMAKKIPAQVAGIFIRLIRPGFKIRELESVKKEMDNLAVDMKYFENSKEATKHAQKTGLIPKGPI